MNDRERLRGLIIELKKMCLKKKTRKSSLAKCIYCDCINIFSKYGNETIPEFREFQEVVREYDLHWE